MARTPTKAQEPIAAPDILPAAELQVIESQRLDIAQQEQVKALAHRLGYDGSLSVGAIEDEIRFYQRRSVESVLECGKRLLLLREMIPRGNSQIGKDEFEQRIEMLGFSKSTAYRFMQAAVKTAKSANLALLSTQVKSASAFLELITHDDDADIERVAEMDDIDRMSASQLRAALRESKQEAQAQQEVLNKKNQRIDKLEREAKRIARLPPDEALDKLRREAAAMQADALAAIRGGVRAALSALCEDPRNTVLAAGLVGELAAELTVLRQDFNLPDVSNAADAQLAAEVAQWGGQGGESAAH